MRVTASLVLIGAMLLAGGSSPAQDRLGCAWSRYVSEERPNYTTCPAGQAISGVRCTGRFCDNVGVYCCALPIQPPPPGYVAPPPAAWGRRFSEENGGRSPGPAFSDGVRCYGGFCDDMSLRPTYALNPSDQCVWKSPVSEEEAPGATCDGGQFVARMQCAGQNCDSIAVQCCSVAGASRVPRTLTLGAIGVDRYILATEAVATERAACPSGYALRGLKCAGDYCGRVTAVCQAYGLGSDTAETRAWSYAFSEEPNDQAHVGAWSDKGFASGVSCAGSHCDEMRVQLLTTPKLSQGACQQHTWFSEEQGEDMCPIGQLVKGISCHGSYCDDLTLTCCAATYQN